MDAENLFICDTSFTVNWLLQSLRENDKEFQKLHGSKNVKNIHATDISGGRGVASEILRCVVTFSDSEETYSTILKVPGLEIFEKIQLKYNGETATDLLKQRFVAAHRKECRFYNTLAPLLKPPVPRVFKTVDWILNQKQGCLHMEDLSLRGKTILYFETVNLTQVKSFIRHLARTHKNNLCADPKLWKGKFVESEEFFMYFFDILEPHIELFLGNCKREKEFRPLLNKYRKIRTSRDFLLYAQIHFYRDLGLDPVIVHGDIHAGNLLWKTNENGDLENELAAILDWQLTHEGSPVEDLARFLVQVPNGVVRRQAEEFAIDYYLECLTDEFGGDASKVPYTAEKLKQAYNYSFVIQTFFTTSLVPFFFAAIENRVSSEALSRAYFESAILKALHAYEDLDRIFCTDLKDVYQKYGL